MIEQITYRSEIGMTILLIVKEETPIKDQNLVTNGKFIWENGHQCCRIFFD